MLWYMEKVEATKSCTVSQYKFSWFAANYSVFFLLSESKSRSLNMSPQNTLSCETAQFHFTRCQPSPTPLSTQPPSPQRHQPRPPNPIFHPHHPPPRHPLHHPQHPLTHHRTPPNRQILTLRHLITHSKQPHNLRQDHIEIESLAGRRNGEAHGRQRLDEGVCVVEEQDEAELGGRAVFDVVHEGLEGEGEVLVEG